jgi:nitric oxide reductase NorQ protein
MTTTNPTATMMVLSTVDGDNRQQMVLLPDTTVYRRTLTGATRTRWRFATVSALAPWTENYVNLTGEAPEPMHLIHGPVLMEVTEDEADEANGGAFPRNMGLRFARVLDAIAADPTSTPAFTGTVREFMDEWLEANGSDDNAWLDRHVHPAGTARPPAPSADPEPEDEAEVPEPEVTTAPSGIVWTYPAIDRKGFVTRPNGERYRTRKIDGLVDVQMLRDARPDREHVFLFGEPGTGKTALVDSAFGTDLVTMLGTEDTEVADFIGGYTTRGGGTYGWTDGAMIEAMERGVPLFVDEVGVIAPKVLTGLFSIMDGRDEIRVTANPDRGTVTAKPGFMVLAATNPHAPGVRISEALLSRFAIHVEVGTDYAMMRVLGVPDTLVTAAENLDVRRKTGEIGWAPQARELLRAKAQESKRGIGFAARNLVSSAPEDEREVVAQVLTRTLGSKITGLVL